MEKAKSIYSYVRDNFTCTDDYGIYMTVPIIYDQYLKRRAGP
jgi:hypothetical protein